MLNRLRGLVVLSLSAGVVAGGCTSDQPPAPEVSRISIALAGATGTPILQSDFEDGTTQGWFPFGSPTVASSTDLAFSGTHSLKITNRTDTYMGPGLSLTGNVQPGATYNVSLAARLLAGQSPTTLQVTVQRSLSDGTQQYDTVVPNTSVTPDGWVTLSGTYSYSGSNTTGLILYVQSASATASFYIDAFSLTQSAPAPISYDFEDGGTDGWFGFGSPTLTNSTDAQFSGTHSLMVTNRTASYMGPALNLQGQLTKGASYQVTMSVRMVSGQPASTLMATMQRTPTGGSATYDSVVTASNVTDQGWSTVTGIYSFTTDNSGLIFYVQTASGNASFFIDAVSFALVTPPAGPPGNTVGAASTFESQTAEGWASRTGGETVAPTNADAHGGSTSLLTTNRTQTYQGPAFNVTNVMFNGSTYHVELWAKLAPGSSPTQLRVSLDRKLGTVPDTFTTLIPNTLVTADAWTLLSATTTVNLANTSLTLYVESQDTAPSFYIDDFKITYIQPAVAERNIPSVYQSVGGQFPIGAAVTTNDLSGEAAYLLSTHYNSMTSENDMKWDATEPSEGNFTFASADAEVAFATAHNMRVRGHTLVWHNQTPAWVFNDASGNPMTATPENRALLIQRMQNHITAVMQHFGSAVGTWDVVNEAIDPAQPDGLRRSSWYNIIGPEYIDLAFQAARAAAPGAKLYLNEYSTTDPTKLAFLASVVSGLKSRGVPIDGVGHQMHNNVDFPQAADVVNAVNTIAALGVENSITELDVSVYSNSFSTPVTDYTDIPTDRFIQQGYRYAAFFQAFRQLEGKIASVTLWGKADDHTWLTSPAKVDGPLLFDTQYQHKYAYWAVVDPLQLPGADLSAAINAAPTSVPAGQAIAYTITVTNNADVNQASYDPTDDDLPATNVVLSTAIPAHTVLQALSAPSGWSCAAPPAGASGPVRCTLPTLPVGGSATFTMTVALSDCATPDASTIVASANVSAATADPNPAPNNAASVSVQVSNPPPVITAIGPLTTTIECGTSYVDPGATASDSCEGAVPVSTSGAVNVSQVGAYAITYDATDRAGGRAMSVVRTVDVSDTTPPVINPVDLTILAPGLTIVVEGGVITVNGQRLPLRWSGHLPFDGHDVSVAGGSIQVDGHALAFDGRTVVLLPPNHGYHTFTMAELIASVTDRCDADLGLTGALISQVTSDETENGNGDGNTRKDIVIGADCRSVQLRMERDGGGNGRVYTIALHAQDASGNRAATSVQVMLPRDILSPAVDDGPHYRVISNCP